MSLTHKFIRWNFTGDGSVQRGARPAFVVNDYEDGHMFLAAVTTRKKLQPTHVFVSCEDIQLRKDSVIMLEQLFWVEYDKKNMPLVIGDLRGNKKMEQEIVRKLHTSLGMIQERRMTKDSDQKIYLGDVFDNHGKDVVIVQNDIGNHYSPTTIVGDLENGKISSIRTVSSDALLTATLKGRKLNVSRQIRELIS